MKKILFLALCLFMAVTATATVSDVYSFEYEDMGVTVIFDESTELNVEKRQYIADVIVYSSGEEGSATYAWCWLTGHDITHDSVTTITHKASPTAPRCYKTIYQVDTCSNCDYVETTEIGGVFIPCCPKD